MTTFLSRLAVHSKLFGLMLERCGIDPAAGLRGGLRSRQFFRKAAKRRAFGQKGGGSL